MKRLEEDVELLTGKFSDSKDTRLILSESWLAAAEPPTGLFSLAQLTAAQRDGTLSSTCLIAIIYSLIVLYDSTFIKAF